MGTNGIININDIRIVLLFCCCCFEKCPTEAIEVKMEFFWLRGHRGVSCDIQSLNPRTLEASLIYTVNSRTARATQNYISKPKTVPRRSVVKEQQ